jgi:hypothetical protein
MPNPKTTSFIAGAVAVLALGYAVYAHRRAAALTETVALQTAAQARTAAALATSEQTAAQFARQAADAELRATDLRRQLDAARATPPRPAPRPLATAGDEARRLQAEKMARLKPLLEGGLPIRGAVVVLVGGKAVPKPVEFVMGRETRITGVDDGTYIVKPSLEPDGSVQYQILLHRKDPATGTESIVTLPRVTQTPWGPFTVSVSGGSVLAFDPDKLEP